MQNVDVGHSRLNCSRVAIYYREVLIGLFANSIVRLDFDFLKSTSNFSVTIVENPCIKFMEAYKNYFRKWK